MTMARNSLIFVLMEIDLFLNRGCNFASADVAMANLDLISLSDFPFFCNVGPQVLEGIYLLNGLPSNFYFRL